MSNIIDKIQLSGVTYDIGGSGSVSTAITSGDTNAVAGGAVYDKFDEVEQVTAQALNVLNDRLDEDEEVTAAALNTLNESLSGKQDTLSAGTNITIVDNVISAEGGGGKAVAAGTNISVTTGETADTINCTLNISNGTGGMSIKSLGASSASANHTAAFGQNTKATKVCAFAEGWGTTASGAKSHSEGDQTKATGGQSHAEGSLTYAIADHSHSEGYASSATSRVTTMVGITTPYGWNTRHSEGYTTIADNGCTHTEGLSTKALNVAEHSSGAYNVSYTASTTWGDSGNTLFSVGNGTSDSARHNAFEIRQNGDIYLTLDGQDVKLQDQLGGSSYTAGDGIDITNDVISVTGKVDTSTYNTYTAATDSRLAEDEEVTAAALNALNTNKQDTLSAGTGISIIDNVISATGGGGGISSAECQTMIDNSISGKADSDDVYTTGQTSGATELATAFAATQPKLSAGTGISIDANNVISATGGGGGGTVESAITSGSSNAVESKAIWSATTYNKEVTLQWDNGFPSKLSTNYPSGCKKFVVTVLSNNTATIMLYNGGSQLVGNITISNWSSPSVSIDGYDGTTYTIDGNDVKFVVPDTITFDNLYCDIRSITSIKAIVEGAWIADNTYMKSEVDVIQNTLQNNINQKLDSTAYTPVNVDSALIENSTNPVEGGVLYDELVYKGAASETTIEWSGNESTNYPSGCTEIKVEVSGSNNGMSISFYDDNWQRFGSANINNWGGISVYFNNLQGATYEISGPTVTISYPSVTGVTKINSSGMVTYTTKAVTYGASTTVKDALGGLKLVKLNQAEYDNLQTKDNSTLYVIVN